MSQQKIKVKPEIAGWSVSTNSNGIVEATVNRDSFVNLLKYVEYLEGFLSDHKRKEREQSNLCNCDRCMEKRAENITNPTLPDSKDAVEKECDRCEGKPETDNPKLCRDCEIDLHGM